MAPDKRPDRLGKFLEYVLARRPDEFGLVPGPDGWFAIKDLLKALSEEPEWRYVRRSHLNEVILSAPGSAVEMTETRIRSRAPAGRPPQPGPLPKLLYTCVRARAYLQVLERGLAPSGDLPLVLSTNRDMALRIGRRRDEDPVLLTVNTAQARAAGALFIPRGEFLYTADAVPPGTFMGPSPARFAEIREKAKAKPAPETKAKEWGSFIVDPADIFHPPEPVKRGGRKKRGWKEDARTTRRRGGGGKED